MTSTKAPTLQQNTITEFLDALAAKVPAPGGGATAAIHLAQAAALVAMVARYTTGPRFAEHADTVDRICERADAERRRAIQLADDDMAAFTAVIEAYALPKGSPERRAATAAAATRAAGVPAAVAAAAVRVVDLAEELLPVANRNVISDIAAAADAARAAATTARVNVEINLSGIGDPLLRESLITRVAQVDAVAGRADSLTARVRKLLM